MLSFSVIIFYSAIEIGPYSLYRKNVISAFKLYKKIVRSRYSFPRKNNNDLSLTSQEPRFCICCVCARTRERALMTRKSCAVGMRNAILRNHLKQQLTPWHDVVYVHLAVDVVNLDHKQVKVDSLDEHPTESCHQEILHEGRYCNTSSL